MIRSSLFGLGYRLIRRIILWSLSIHSKIRSRPFDLEDGVRIGDRWLRRMDRVGGRLWFHFPVPDSIGVDLYDLHFPSPVMIASFKEDQDVLNTWLKLGVGSITLKTILPDMRGGNPRPRLQEISLDGRRGLMNAMGLPGPGVDRFCAELPNSDLWQFGRPLGISIGGNSVADYQQVFDKIEATVKTTEFSYYYELNISCPNTPEGQDIAKNPDLLHEVLQHIRHRSDAVVVVKISSDQSDEVILKTVQVAHQYAKIAINAGNTVKKSVAEIGLDPASFSMPEGGVSGPPIFQSTLRLARRLKPTGIPVIATGGISTPEQIRQLQQEGVRLFGIATAAVLNPYVIPKLNRYFARNQ